MAGRCPALIYCQCPGTAGAGPLSLAGGLMFRALTTHQVRGITVQADPSMGNGPLMATVGTAHTCVLYRSPNTHTPCLSVCEINVVIVWISPASLPSCATFHRGRGNGHSVNSLPSSWQLLTGSTPFGWGDKDAELRVLMPGRICLEGSERGWDVGLSVCLCLRSCPLPRCHPPALVRLKSGPYLPRAGSAPGSRPSNLCSPRFQGPPGSTHSGPISDFLHPTHPPPIRT